MRGGHRGRGGRGGDGRSVHERLGPVPTWSGPASTPAPISRDGQGSFDRSRLGRPRRHSREEQQQLRPGERREVSGSRSTSGRPVARHRSRSVEELESSIVRGRSPAHRSRSPRQVVRRRASQSMSPARQPAPALSRRDRSPRRSPAARRHGIPPRQRSSSLRHGLPRRSRSPEFHRRRASPTRYQRLGSPRSPARHFSPRHHHSPGRFRTSPPRNRSPFPPQGFSPRRLTPPSHQLLPRPISPRRPFHQRLSPRGHSSRRSPPGHHPRQSPRRHSPRRHFHEGPSPRRLSPRQSPRGHSFGRSFQDRHSPRRHSPRRLSPGRNSPSRQSPRRHSPRRHSPRRHSPRRDPPPRHPDFSHQPFAARESHPGRQSLMPAGAGVGVNTHKRQHSGARPSDVGEERSGRQGYSPIGALRNQVEVEKRQKEERQRASKGSDGQRVASPREVTVSDRSISVTKRFSQPEGKPEKRFKPATTEESGGRPSTSHPSTSKRTGRPARRSPGKSGPSDQKSMGRHVSDDQRASRPGPDSSRAHGRQGPDDQRASMRPGSDDHSHRSSGDRAADVWRQELPPPPRISQVTSGEDQDVGQSQSSRPEAASQAAAVAGPSPSPGMRQPGKTLLHHFCEQAALSGQSLAKVRTEEK